MGQLIGQLTGDLIANSGNIFKSGIDATQRKKQEELTLREAQNNLQNIEDILTQTNSYNTTIPVIFGTASLAGNIIWTGQLTAYINQNGKTSISNSMYDTALTGIFGNNSQGNSLLGEFGLLNNTTSELTAVYKLDFAIGICEGEIDELISVKANSMELDLSKYTYRFYNGSKSQMPDGLIEETEGIGKTPAFRGLCYIIFEDFPISDFGNSIPSFIFSVQRNVSKNNENSVNNLVKGITLIPGTGEFAYHTEKITKYQVRGTRKGDVILTETAESVNYHNNRSQSNVLCALDNLRKQMPNIEWVSVVVCWFGDSIDIESCSVYPACEFNEYDLVTQPHTWSVAGKTRKYARVIGKDANGNMRYGGTPSDSSVISLLQELKNRGYKVNLIPMLMMDINGKPWRGRLTGSANIVNNFFHKTDGYNTFVKHYANLCKSYIDCLVIGTEMVGLTKINDGNNIFPAVNEFCSLAGEVRSIVGNGIKLTYAADWSEYHHTDGGFYNMDKLWANSNIDFIGIDAYFPLTNTTVKPLINEIKEGWESGEGWDFYYNEDRTKTMPLEPKWAWKNIRWFVENTHINADGTSTSWQPNMKKVWFVEYGFPSVDLCTNQPNVFYDPTSTESFFPRNSNGYVDYESQNNAIIATENYWKENSDIVENKFLWTWDARPYPFFPRFSSLWADSPNWQYGHWINGKVTSSYIGDITSLVFEKSGINNFEDGGLSGVVHGMVLKGGQTAKSILSSLALLYNFRIFQHNGKVIGRNIKNLEHKEIDEENILIDEEQAEILESQNIQGSAVRKVTLYFYDINKDYNINHAYFEDLSKTNGIEQSISVPFVLSNTQATEIAKKTLIILNSSTTHTITLPAIKEYSSLYAGMVVYFIKQNFYGVIENILHEQSTIKLEVIGISESLLEDLNEIKATEAIVENISTVAMQVLPSFEIIDTYNFTNIALTEGVFPLWFAFRNIPKQGISFYYSTQESSNYIKLFEVYSNSVMGEVVSYEHTHVSKCTIDEINKFEILIYGVNSLQGISKQELLEHKNLCIIGNELCSFQNVEALDSNTYRISTFLRGRFGTEIEQEIEGKRFVLQNGIRQFSFSNNVNKMYFKAVPHGSTLEETTPVEFIPEKNGIKNWNIQKIETLTKENGDILVSWKEQSVVRKSFFASSQTYLKSFFIKINNVRFVNVTGVNSFLYTKEMQEQDGVTGDLNITVEEI